MHVSTVGDVINNTKCSNLTYLNSKKSLRISIFKALIYEIYYS